MARGKGRAHGRGRNQRGRGAKKPGNPAARRGAVPFPWDEKKYDQRITANFIQIEADARTAAISGVRPTSALVLDWHRRSLDRVPVAEPWVKGHYRGQGPPTSQLHSCINHVDGILGAMPNHVARRVLETFTELDARLDAFDGRVSASETVTEVYADVLAVCAWLHGEWIRIHPLANHNGSTARLLTVMVALRYGIPMSMPGKPRSAMPGPGLHLDYNVASSNQMHGDDQLMVTFLDQVVRASLQP